VAQEELLLLDQEVVQVEHNPQLVAQAINLAEEEVEEVAVLLAEPIILAELLVELEQTE